MKKLGLLILFGLIAASVYFMAGYCKELAQAERASGHFFLGHMDEVTLMAEEPMNLTMKSSGAVTTLVSIDTNEVACQTAPDEAGEYSASCLIASGRFIANGPMVEIHVTGAEYVSEDTEGFFAWRLGLVAAEAVVFVVLVLCLAKARYEDNSLS